MCQSRVQRRTPSVRILAKYGAYYNEYGFIGVGPGGVSIGPRPAVGRSLPTIERGNRTITRRERCRLRERKLS